MPSQHVSFRAAPLCLAAALCPISPLRADGPGRQWAYPPAARGEVVDDYHGAKVADPYRSLEDLDSPATRAWVEAENRLTFDFLGQLPQRRWFHDRLTQLWNFPRYGLPFKEGGRYFFTKNDGLQNQPVLYVQAAPGAAPRMLIDPNALAADGTAALTSVEVSRDGRLIAYGIAAAGSDWTEFRVRDVDTGRDTGDVIRRVKFSAPAWTRDCRGFFYSRFPESKAVGSAATFGELAHQQVYYHRLGTPQEEDRLIFAYPDEPKWFLGAGVTEDGRYALIVIGRGDSHNNLLRYLPLGDPANPEVGAPIARLIDTWDAEYDVIGNDGPVLYVLTTLDAPRRRIIAIDTRAPDRANWKTIVPEGADTIESAALLGGRLVARTMHDASSRLALYSRDGAPAGFVPLPGLGSVAGISGHEDDPELFYNFTSFTQPAANFQYNLATGANELYQAPRLSFDPAAYETKQVFYASKDGTRVPMFITAQERAEARRRDARPALRIRRIRHTDDARLLGHEPRLAGDGRGLRRAESARRRGIRQGLARGGHEGAQAERL